MLSIKKILHPTDFSDGAATAFEHALHLARHYEAALHVLHVAPIFGEDPIRRAYESAADDTSMLQERMDEADAQMRALIEVHPHRHVSLRRVLSRGAAAGPVILDYARAEAVDLIVMGTHGRRGVRHLLLGSVAEEVAHKASCHIMTVRRQEEPKAEPRPIQSIGVAIDFSDFAASVLETAKAMAASYGAMLHLVNVLQPLPLSLSITQKTLYDLVPDIAEQSRARLEELYAATPGPDVPATFHVVEGQPARAIVALAEERLADLLLIAPRGLTGVERLMLGSVAERVVRTASCPVFIVKTDVPDDAEAQKDATTETASFES